MTSFLKALNTNLIRPRLPAPQVLKGNQMNNGKYDAADLSGHNSGISQIPEHTVNAAGERLLSFVQRYENLEDEKQAIMSDQKELKAELKSAGYEPKIFMQLIRIRKMEPDQRAEQEALLETYLSAIGMNSQPDLFQSEDES